MLDSAGRLSAITIERNTGLPATIEIADDNDVAVDCTGCYAVYELRRFPGETGTALLRLDTREAATANGSALAWNPGGGAATGILILTIAYLDVANRTNFPAATDAPWERPYYADVIVFNGDDVPIMPRIPIPTEIEETVTIL